jgi:hypothetical protein
MTIISSNKHDIYVRVWFVPPSSALHHVLMYCSFWILCDPSRFVIYKRCLSGLRCIGVYITTLSLDSKVMYDFLVYRKSHPSVEAKGLEGMWHLPPSLYVVSMFHLILKCITPCFEVLSILDCMWPFIVLSFVKDILVG